MRLRKKGMEIAVNFLVMLVVSLVLFGMSLYFINQFRQTAKIYEGDLDKYAVDQLRQLSRGSSFALFPESVDVRVGESSQVGVGVTNTEKPDLKGKLHVDFAGAYDAGGNPLDTSTNTVDSTVANSWVKNLGTETTLKSGAFSSFLVLATPTTPSWTKYVGSYTFDVCFLRTGIIPAEGTTPEVKCAQIVAGAETTNKQDPTKGVCVGVSTSNSKCLYHSNVIKGLTIVVS